MPRRDQEYGTTLTSSGSSDVCLRYARYQPAACPELLAKRFLAETPTAATNSEFGHLRVYRQRRYVGAALAPSIFVDDNEVARVGNGRRVGIKLSPGSHTIRSDDKSSAITLDVKPGQEYFVRVDEATGFWKGHGKLTMLLPEQGSPEYKLQKPIETERRVAANMLEDVEEASTPSETATPAKNEKAVKN